ncbi:amidase [Polychaeton citri CBS 116435]|uniref:Amidase n=1 Tax=Polychaeton citri CBS 116435 TaxID=1314669 RepID=A0A9P4Q6B8_9PEZI|nr:amidase [Polychaeton citri CBS 116435]
MTWEDVAAERQQHRAKTIAEVQPAVPGVPSELPLNVTAIPRQLLPAEVVTITEQTTEDLVLALANGRLSALAVTQAFLQRAGLACKLTNCITELMPRRALDRAQYLDQYYKDHQKPIGPLHGVPISVKEHIGMKDLDWNAGFVSWVGKTAPKDAFILQLLWNSGAVFYARTTQPQTLMHLETSNNLYGVTVNPFNRSLTCGGSSGGEGALGGMRGSCLGIGTDIGGSIRSPAANQGLFGLRPTSYRLPCGGFAATMLGEEQIVPVVGPISTSLGGIKLFMKSLIDQQPWLHEAALLPFPWKETSSSGTLLRQGQDGRRKLRVGVLTDDGIVKPHPPVLRGLKTLVDKLKVHPDVELVDFPPLRHEHAWSIISSLYFADGGSEEREAIDASGEPWRPLSKFILIDNPNVKKLSVPEVWKWTVEREAYRDAYAAHWNSTASEDGHALDVVLCPVGPGCAPPIDCARYWSYTSQWNLLDYPSIVFPTGLSCQPELDPAETTYTPRNAHDKYNHELYKPETYVDAPISLQLVGRRYEDEKVIEALEMISELADMPEVGI